MANRHFTASPSTRYRALRNPLNNTRSLKRGVVSVCNRRLVSARIRH